MTTQQEYEKLCQLLWHHNRLYYIEHAPEITDEEYDFLFARLERIEKDHPNWVQSSSPTQRVNESLTIGFQTASHRTPMLSLANTYSKEEIVEFIQRMQKLLVNKQKVTFCTELKMDGIAISAIFKEGKFVQGITRGDGKQGDEITVNLRTISALPLQLYGENIPDFLELRGEVFMPRAVFAKLNEQKLQDGEVLWANPRNAAAGSLKLLNPQEVAVRSLAIVFYGIADSSSPLIHKQSEVAPLLRSFGLPTLDHVAYCETIEEIWEFAEKIREKRASLPYAIDGIVIKLDNLNEQKRLGVTGKNPRWAIAYKFAAEQAVSQILAITVQVGRTGTLTPVAELQPVFLAGSKISRATLHNEEEIQRKDIRIGDQVIIEKGGDVIPKIVSVDLAQRLPNSIPWQMPALCPSCGEPVSRIENEVAVRCLNASSCKEQQIRRLIYFAGKDAMDIDHLGEKVITQLVQKGFIQTPSDIFALQEEQISQLTGFKIKSIQNLLISLEKSKEVSLARFIMALNIKYIGVGIAELLAARAGTIEKLSQMKEEELLKIEGIGFTAALAVVQYFLQPVNQKEVQRLLALGVRPQVREVQIFESHSFYGKQFVLTGSLESYTRATAASLIKERGGRVMNTISKKTDFLIAGVEAGSKLEKARELGITILDEAAFICLL